MTDVPAGRHRRHRAWCARRAPDRDGRGRETLFVREQVPLLAAPITQSLSDISEDRWNLIDVAMLDPIVPAPIAMNNIPPLVRIRRSSEPIRFV